MEEQSFRGELYAPKLIGTDYLPGAKSCDPELIGHLRRPILNSLKLHLAIIWFKHDGMLEIGLDAATSFRSASSTFDHYPAIIYRLGKVERPPPAVLVTPLFTSNEEV